MRHGKQEIKCGKEEKRKVFRSKSGEMDNKKRKGNEKNLESVFLSLCEEENGRGVKQGKGKIIRDRGQSKRRERHRVFLKRERKDSS